MALELKLINGIWHKKVFAKFRLVNGRKQYPKKAKCFVFWVPVL